MFTSKLISRVLSILMVAILMLAWIRPAGAASPSVSTTALDPSAPTQTVKLIFIHHSTGENWLTDGYGNLGQSLLANNYFVSDTNYGWGPNAIGDRTDIPNWTEWFSSASTPTYMNALYNESGQHSTYTRTLTDPGGENQIIMFKSCFPNSALEGNPNDPPSADGWLTVGHAKYVYNQILQYFGAHPEKLFVVITAPPLQDGTYAANARAFNQWLMNNWLADNNYTGTNVVVFDFYNVLTGSNNHHRYYNSAIEHVFTPGMNTLYYPSSGGDDHPNAVGSQKATSEFVSLLNIFYHRWQAAPAAFGKTAPSNTATDQSLSPTLSWESSDGATSYEYCYSSALGPCSKWNSVGTNTSVTLKGLAANYTYYWQVRAGGITEADGGTWWSFTTQSTPVCSRPVYTAPTMPTFADVPMDVGHWSWVERLSNAGITAGCGGGNFCPGTEVIRAQMTIFLLRGKYCGSSYIPPTVGGNSGFNDVPAEATYASWVKQLAVDGITAGCGNGNFCPGGIVNRSSMAIFLLRARHGGTYSPPTTEGSSGFNDVPADSSYAPWVKQLATEGITAGCGNGNFCPGDNVNRAQMAIFLVRVFGLP